MTVNFIAQDLLKYDRLLIILHEYPDGDTIGSSVALADALAQNKKYVRLVCRHPIPEPFQFLISNWQIENDFILGDWDAIILVDCGDLKRTGFSDRIKKFARVKKRLFVIDHHFRSDLHRIANFGIVDQSLSSAGEIVYRLLGDLGIKITSRFATPLLAALYTDTGGFMHSNTTSSTLKVASRLLNAGGRLKSITRKTRLSKSVAALKLWGIALGRLRRDSLGLVSSVLTQDDISSCRATDSDIAGVINLINTVPDARAAILLVETSLGKIKASLRTEHENVDVSRLAAIFGGGGHKKAAGFVVGGQLTQTAGSFKVTQPSEQPSILG